MDGSSGREGRRGVAKYILLYYAAVSLRPLAAPATCIAVSTQDLFSYVCCQMLARNALIVITMFKSNIDIMAALA